MARLPFAVSNHKYPQMYEDGSFPHSEFVEDGNTLFRYQKRTEGWKPNGIVQINVVTWSPMLFLAGIALSVTVRVAVFPYDRISTAEPPLRRRDASAGTGPGRSRQRRRAGSAVSYVEWRQVGGKTALLPALAELQLISVGRSIRSRTVKRQLSRSLMRRPRNRLFESGEAGEGREEEEWDTLNL